MGGVIVIDTFGLLWLSKKVQLPIVKHVAHVTQRLIWTGWIGLVLSGTVLIFIKGNVDNLTVMKLFFVALVGVNGYFMHTIKRSLEPIKGNKVPAQLMFRIGLASTISQVGWWSAIAIGFLHRHWQHYINWPHAPEIYIGVIITGIALVALTGEILFHNPEPEGDLVKD